MECLTFLKMKGGLTRLYLINQSFNSANNRDAHRTHEKMYICISNMTLSEQN